MLKTPSGMPAQAQRSIMDGCRPVVWCRRWLMMIWGRSWMDQHVAPSIPRAFAAAGVGVGVCIAVNDDDRPVVSS